MLIQTASVTSYNPSSINCTTTCVFPFMLCVIMLQAKIAFLQGERRGHENLMHDLVRRIKMLEFALKQERCVTVCVCARARVYWSVCMCVCVWGGGGGGGGTCLCVCVLT